MRSAVAPDCASLAISALAAYAVDNSPAILILVEGASNDAVALDACDRLLALMLDRAAVG